MSGDVQPRKRKDKKRKKDDSAEQIPTQIQAPPSNNQTEDLNIHVHKEDGTGGGICAKIIFFLLFSALAVLIALIISEHRGLTDLDTVDQESRFSHLFEGWIDNSLSHDEHDDDGDHAIASSEDHEEEAHDEDEEEEEEDHDENEGEGEASEEVAQTEEEDEEEDEEEIEASEEAPATEEEDDEEEDEEEPNVSEVDEENASELKDADEDDVSEEIVDEDEDDDEEIVSKEAEIEQSVEDDNVESKEQEDEDGEDEDNLPQQSEEVKEEDETPEVEETPGDPDETEQQQNSKMVVKIGVGVALLVVAHVVLVRKWKSAAPETPGKDEVIPDLSRRNTIIVPPSFQEVQRDIEDAEEEYSDEDGEVESDEERREVKSAKAKYGELRATYERSLTPESEPEYQNKPDEEEYEDEEEEEEDDEEVEEEEEEEDEDDDLLKRLEARYGTLHGRTQVAENEEDEQFSSWKRVNVRGDNEAEESDSDKQSETYEYENITNKDDYKIKEKIDEAHKNIQNE